jgi:hypothetical protein
VQRGGECCSESVPQAVGPAERMLLAADAGGAGKRQELRLESAEGGKVIGGAVTRWIDGGERRIDFAGSMSPVSMYNALSLARGISGVSEGEVEGDGERE